MSTTLWVVLAWLLVSLHCLVGVTLRFCVALTTGEDPIDALRPRRALVRDAICWPLLAFFIVLIALGENVTIAAVAAEFKENARLKSRLRRREAWEPPNDGVGT